MKLSTGYIKTAFKVTEKETGRKYDCFIQYYDYMNGKKATRFNVGINGHTEWTFCAYYSEDDFNRDFTVD